MSAMTAPLSLYHQLIDTISDDNQPLRLSGHAAYTAEAVARSLAAYCRRDQHRSPRGGLLERVRANQRGLIQAHCEFAAALAAGDSPPPAAEWLLDNFYIIDEVFRDIITHLPQGYYTKLPSITEGAFAGLPGAYPLALGLLHHTDSNLDESTLLSYVRAYQEICPLTIGEVWAIPIMLRIGLLESLTRLAQLTRATSAERAVAAKSLHTTELPANPTSAFVAGVLHALRDRQEVSADVAERVNAWLTRLCIDSAALLQREHHRQAADQVSIGNAVTSLRLMAALDWAQFFERVSVVEQILRAEPTGIYTRQTFATRDSYRSAIERLARGSQFDEIEIAKRAIESAQKGNGVHQSHLGYYLIGEGNHDFGRSIGYRPPLRDWLRESLKRWPGVAYFGMLALFTVGMMVTLSLFLSPTSWLLWLLIWAVTLLLASEVALALTNFLVCRLLPPRVLPRMDFRDGVPGDFATFVVIPGMLTRPQSAQALLDRLELHYLANPDPNLSFALLTDFADAPAEHMPNDEECIKAAMDGVRKLNEKHTDGGTPRFFVLHRRRLYNPSEGCWMGWERKRGKLHEFNRLLRGATDTSYAHCSVDPATLPRLRFVLTLDSDTVLPRDAAATLIGTLAHPLNSPVKTADGRRIQAGYSIFQPRVSFLYKTAWRSLFARLYAYSAGIDPYSSAVSDTYMDLFARGTFTGKGLYDVDAYEATAGRALPENHILSHDLIESTFARCALVSDVEVFDDFPARYTAYSRREHRWARGDWQLLPWLTPSVPTAHEGRVHNPLPALERWKIIDNLRRTVVPAALLSLLTFGWLLLPASAWLWTVAAIVILTMPLLLHAFSTILSVRTVGVRPAWVNARAGFGSTLGQALLSLAFLPHQAFNLLDAIRLTLWRLIMTRKRMLEWEAAAATEARLSGTLVEFLRAMWPAPVWSLAVGGTLAWLAPDALPAALALLLVWVMSPGIAWLVSRPSALRKPQIAESERPMLRRLACKTWNFFEAFVGEADHWLPPDNYQEAPVEAIAHRTSPTNIGLLLTSTLAAHDLGYITLPQLVERLESTLRTLAQLARHHGHFLNWYDTRTLSPLPPAYVSSVDSGNLLGCLLVLAQGLIEKRREKIPSPVALAGLRDRLVLLREEVDRSSAKNGISLDELRQFENLLNETPMSVAVWSSLLTRLGEMSGRWKANHPDEQSRAEALTHAITARQQEIEAISPELLQRLDEIVRQVRRYADEMDFRFLYNPRRQLFAIGYHVPRETLDQAHYDLLASEACLTSFLAIGRGEAPRRHWFQLGRPIIRVGGTPGLLSWSGTMFEFLMPRLFLPVPAGTLLHTAWVAAVSRQIEYGKQTHTPWGISESAYNMTDVAGNYQYQAFGVPGLGLKRGLGRDLVIAPYATVLALPLAPREVVANIRKLATTLHAEGWHGLYEAIDYTPERQKSETQFTIVRSYMAHHQGMILIALANALLGDLMPARLAREPSVRAVDLLLEERVPLDAPVIKPREETQQPPATSTEAVSRRFVSPHSSQPRPHLLSNGRYHLMLTTTGAGVSTRDTLDVTRWRADPTCENYGQFIYVRDVKSGEVWSAGYQPVRREADEYEVIYSIDKAEFRRRDGLIETHTEVTVSPEDDAEVRRVRVVNHGDTPREVELISYAEVVLMPHAADRAHPAFHKLFLQTSKPEDYHALICRRRPRSAEEKTYFAVHVLATEELSGPVEYETDRARFLGRRGPPTSPRALAPGGRHTGTLGAVLDPIFSIRCRMKVPAGGRTSVCFSTGVVESDEHAMFLVNRFSSMKTVDRVFELAWAQACLELRHMNLTIREAQLYQRLAGQVVFGSPGLRADAEVLCGNRQGQAGLWRHGISGEFPIVLLRMPEGADAMELYRRLINAHTYWATHGLRTDLVVLNDSPTTYRDEVHNELMNLARVSEDRDRIDRPGGIFIRKTDQFSPDDLVLLQAWARVILEPSRGSLEDQVGVTVLAPPMPDPFRAAHHTDLLTRTGASIPQGLRLFNGKGGFSPDGHEYVIAPGAVPPMPWVNVIANPNFGFLVSESGSGYAWALNSQLNRLTPWSNDPVSDPPGEIIYLRDEQTGEVWSPTPLPAGRPTLVRHGAGYSVFEQRRDKLKQELTVFVPQEDSVKVSLLRISNLDNRPRRLTVTYFIEWVLGTHRDVSSSHHITTHYNAEAGVLHACNSANSLMAPAVAFAAMSPRPTSWTADRTEFLGRNHHSAEPAGLGRVCLSGRTGVGLDPCAALQSVVELAPGQSIEVVCLLGTASNEAAAQQLTERYREPAAARGALLQVRQDWDQRLDAVQVNTPDESLDLMINRWLLYQAISCRLWGRTGFYQSGGAYGFRDQLQDVMALVHAAPQLAREQILRAASRQFKEGDVQHWWHPPTGAGVRTRFSDDFLWLVLVSCVYAEATGDWAVFDERVNFLEAPLLEPHQEESYSQPRVAAESTSLYDHCLRALEHGWRLGAHGLPLMGTGDWNDGMNKVGAGGKGESVWVAWFQKVCLELFATLADQRDDAERASICRERAGHLLQAVEAHAWDGRWYRRAYFDDGTPLGSSTNDECSIDSLAQSWAVLGGGDPQRGKMATIEAVARLVKPADQLVLLFDPPFDNGPLQPGYIKGYVPGTRENGGQYTHAAVWLVQALAHLREGNRAMEVLEMLLPTRHTLDSKGVTRYQAEPYVVAADVYGKPPHVGRAGWTWYTGSAGWMYQVTLEDILGVRRRGNQLLVDPCIPSTWHQFEVTYRVGQTVYAIIIENPEGVQHGVKSVTLDGITIEGAILLADDGPRHEVRVRMGA